MNPNKVSIVLPTFKRDKNLNRAINSIISQTYADWELLIVDDNPPDSEERKKCESIYRIFKKDKRIRYIKHNRNKGGSAARNTGILQSKCDFIGFLDDDDTWSKDKLLKMMNVFTKLPNDYGVCFSSYFIVTKGGTLIENKKRKSGNIYKSELLNDYVGPTSVVMLKRECFSFAGYFDESLPARQDYDLWIRVSKYYNFHFVNEPLAYIYRIQNKKRKSISADYNNNIQGTEIVLKKYLKEINNYGPNFKKKVFSRHYRYLGKMLWSFCEFDLSFRYLFKSLRHRFDYSTLLLIVLSLFRKPVYNIIQRIKILIRKKEKC